MQTSRRQVAANVVWSFAGTAAVAGAQWLAIAVLARESTPETVGVFALGYAITAPLALFFGLNVRIVLASDAAGRYRLRDLLALRLMGLALGALCLLAITRALALSGVGAAVAWALFTARVCDAASEVVYGRLQRDERMARIAVSRVLQGVLQITVFVAVFRRTGDLALATAGLAIASGAVTAGFDVPALFTVGARGTRRPCEVRVALRALACGWDARTLVRLLVFVLPLATLTVLDSLNANIPRYVLERTHGPGALGYFASLAAFFFLYGAVVQALADAIRARLARAVLVDHGRFVRDAGRLLTAAAAIGTMAVIGAYSLGASALTIAYGPDYAQHRRALCWFMAAAGVWGVSGCLAVAMQAAQRFAPIAGVFAIMTMVTSAAAALLVPRFGVQGAVWAVCLGMVVRLSVLTVVWRRLVGELEVEAPRHEPVAAAIP